MNTWNERPDRDLTFSVSAKEYHILDKVTREIKRIFPFTGFKFDEKLQHYVAINEPEYDKDTEDIALCYM